MIPRIQNLVLPLSDVTILKIVHLIRNKDTTHKSMEMSFRAPKNPTTDLHNKETREKTMHWQKIFKREIKASKSYRTQS